MGEDDPARRDADYVVETWRRRVLESGVQALEAHVRDLLDRGGYLRLLAGDYLGITDHRALAPARPGTTGTFDVHLFESQAKSFHLKAYIFHGSFQPFGRAVAYVGSSNLSRSALTER